MAHARLGDLHGPGVGGVEEALTSRMVERCWVREAVGGWWGAEGVSGLRLL